MTGKRNTSRAVFTSYERAQAKSAWSSTSARLSRDSFLPFASCRLCLLPARTPVSCPHGDIFCRECALNSILTQRKEIKRLEKVAAQESVEKDEEAMRDEEEARQRAVEEFEKVQMGLEAKVGKGAKVVGRVDGRVEVVEEQDGGKRGEKRKFELDEEELLRIAQTERARARKSIDDEKAAKTTLPSFWVPSITPSSNTTTALHTIAKKVKQSPMCPAAEPGKPHPYSLATLIPVSFSEEKDDKTGELQRVCPSCKKALSNGSKAVLTKPCGHVLCKSCVTKFMTPSGVQDPDNPEVDNISLRCYVCDEDLSDKADREGKRDGKKEKERVRPGVVEIKSEGTGFASGGANVVGKIGVAFQC